MAWLVVKVFNDVVSTQYRATEEEDHDLGPGGSPPEFSSQGARF
jgi:hypothetical protein